MRRIAKGICHNCGYDAKYGHTVQFLGDYELCASCIQLALDMFRPDPDPEDWEERLEEQAEHADDSLS